MDVRRKDKHEADENRVVHAMFNPKLNRQKKLTRVLRKEVNVLMSTCPDIEGEGATRGAVEKVVGELAEPSNICVKGRSKEGDETAHVRVLRHFYRLYERLLGEVRRSTIAREYIHLHPTRCTVESIGHLNLGLRISG